MRLLDGHDEAGIFARLAKWAGNLGYTVQVTPEVDGYPDANGLCEHGAQRITVAGIRSPAQQVKEAESAAYVVGRHLGTDTSDYSFGSVLGWQRGDAAKAREAIEASGKAISYAARKIIDGLEAQREPVAEVRPAEDKDAELEPVAWPGQNGRASPERAGIARGGGARPPYLANFISSAVIRAISP